METPAKTTRPAKRRRKFTVEQMEPRILLSASPGFEPALLAAAQATVALPAGGPSSAQNSGVQPQVQAPVNWVGTGSGDWDVASNWSTNTVPGATDDVVITQTGITITVEAGNQAAQSLMSAAAITVAGGSLTLGSDSQISGTLTVNGSTLTTNGTLTASGTTTLENFGTLAGTGALAISGTASITNTFTLDASLNNAGTLTFSSGNLDFGTGATLTNESGATLNLSGGVGVVAPGTLANAGTLNNTGGFSTISATFNNTGTVQVTGGTFALINDGTSSGTFNVDSTATLQFYATPDGDDYQIAPGATWNGAGLYLVTNFATVTLNDPSINLSPENFELDNYSTVTGPGDLNIPSGGLFTWNGGTLSGTGTTAIAAGATLTSGASADFLDTRTIDNSGAISFSSTGLDVYNNAPITNEAGATFTFASSSINGGVVQNSGTFTSSGTSSLLGSFTNSGTADSTTGTLAISAGSSTGIFDASSGATISFANYIFNSGTALNDSGTYTIDGATSIAQGVTISPLNLTIALSSPLNGPGTLTVPANGVLINNGGAMPAITNISPTATFTINTNFNFGGGVLNNYGTINAFGAIDVQPGAIITNETGANYDVTGVNLAVTTPLAGFIGDGTLNNSGTITLDAPSVVFDADSGFVVNNNGTIQIEQGTATLLFGGSSTGGTYNVSAGASLSFGGSTVFNAGTVLEGDGDFTMNGGASFTLNDSNLTLSPQNLTLDGDGDAPTSFVGGTGSLVIPSGATWTIGGFGLSITNAGGITVQGGGTLNIPSGVTFTGASIDNSGTLSIGSSFDLTTGTTLTNEALGTTTITGGPFYGSGSIVNDGLITVESSFTIFGSFSNTGTFSITSGTVTLRNVTQVSADGTTLTGGTWNISGGATLSFGTDSGNTSTITTNEAIVTIDGANSQFTPFSNLSSNSGTIILLDGATLNSGQLDPDGNNIPGPLTNSGTIEAGDGATLNITTDYTQTSTGTLQIDLGGAPGSMLDGQVTIAGTANLGGELDVQTDNGFGPNIGDQFTMLTYGSVLGDFATQNGVGPLFSAAEGNAAYTLTTISNGADLTPVNIQVPANGTAGQNVTISYTVTNAGLAGTNSSQWYDSLYLSANSHFDGSAVLIGRVLHTGSLGAGDSYTGTIDASWPGVQPGSYHLFLVTDSREQVADADRGNNTFAAPGTTTITVPALTVGASTSGTIANGQYAYYEVTLPAGTSTITLNTSGANGGAELYLRQGDVPSLDVSDAYQFNVQSSQQQITLPNAAGGTYYILVHGRDAAGTGVPFTVEADQPAFGLTATSASAGTNAGNVTLTLSGDRFSPTTTFSLVEHGATTAIAASSVVLQSSASAYATFDLQGAVPGTYDIVAQDGGATSTLASAFAISPEPAITDGSALTLSMVIPPVIRPNRAYTITVYYTNNSDVDIPAPLLTLASTNASFALPGEDHMSWYNVSFIAFGPPGLVNILPAHYHGSIDITFQPLVAGAHVNSTFTLSDADPTAPLEIDTLTNSLRPAGTYTDAQWALIAANLQQQFGTTYGTLTAALDLDATLLPASLGPNQEPVYLEAINLLKAESSIGNSITGVATSSDPSLVAPGLELIATNTDTGAAFTTNVLNDGSYYFNNLTAGDYTITAEGAVAQTSGSLTLAAGQTLSGIGVSLAKGASITGTVTDAGTGQPIGSGASIDALSSDGVTSYLAQAGTDGTYSLAGLIPGTYTLTIQAEGYARDVVGNLVIGSNTNLFEGVALAPEGIVSGTVSAPGAATGATLNAVLQLEGTTDPNDSYADTSTDGTFSVDQLPAGTYDLTLSEAGFLNQTITGLAVAAGTTTAAGSFTLVPTAVISGTLTSSDPNNPVDDTPVSAYQNGAVVATAMADSTGAFTLSGLAAGSYTLQAVLPQTGYSTAVTVGVTAGQDVTGVALQIQPGAELTGIVSNATTQAAIGGVTVYLGSPGSTGVLTTTTDSSGNYSFADLGPGNYTVYTGGGETAGQNFTVTTPSGQIAQNLTLQVSATLGGTLSAANGSALVNGVVTLYSGNNAIASTAVDANGNYSFAIAQPGTYDLVAQADNASFIPDTGISVATGANVSANFISGSSTLTVNFTDSTQSVTGATVRIFMQTPQGELAAGYGQLEASGSITFSNLTPGNYSAAVYGANDRDAQGAATVAAGSNSLGLAASTYATVSGSVTGGGAALSGVYLTLMPAGNPNGTVSAVTGAAGTYQFTDVAPGQYDLVAFVNGYQASVIGNLTVGGTVTQNVALTAATTVITGQLVSASGAPLGGGSVSITDSSGHLVGAATPDANGNFSIDTATGSGLTLQALANGCNATIISNVNATGATVALGAVTLQFLALPTQQAAASAGLVTSTSAPSPTGPAVSAQSTGLLPQDGPTQSNWLLNLINLVNDLDSQINLYTTSIPTPGQCSKLQSQYDTLVRELQIRNQEFAALQQLVPICLAQFGLTLFSLANLAATVYTTAFAVGKAAAGIGELAGNPTLATYFQGLPGLQAQQYAGYAASLIGAMSAAISASSGPDTQSALQNEAAIFQNSAQFTADGSSDLAQLFAQFKDSPAELAQAAGTISNYFGILGAIGNLLSVPEAFNTAVDNVDTSTQYDEQFRQQEDQAFAYANKLESEITNYKNALANESMQTGCNQGPSMPVPPPAAMPQPQGGGTQQRTPGDPNDMTGPAGYGPQNFTGISTPLPYTIEFENMPTAEAPAQQVIITEQLDPNLDWSTFQLGNFAFGNVNVTVPAGRSSYSTQLDETSTLGIYVDFNASLNEQTGLVTWTLTSIDPNTGDIPQNGTLGFLPPDTQDPNGVGAVSYSILPKATDATGTVISASASIVFDTNAAMSTPTVTNTLDAVAPTSHVNALPAQSGPDLTLSWAGEDDSGGSGIRSYSIFESVNGGSYQPLLSNTTQTAADFVGVVGDTYSFYSIATDNVGNVQAAPAQPDTTVMIVPGTTTLVDAKHPFKFVDANGNPVTVKLTGPGSATASLVYGVANDADLYALVLSDTTAATNLTVTITKLKGKSDETDVGGITTAGTDESIGTIMFEPGVTLGDGFDDGADNLSITGSAKTLDFGALADNAQLVIGSGLTTALAAKTAPAITLGSEIGSGTSITSDAGIGALAIDTSFGGTISATDAIGPVTILGTLNGTIEAAAIGNIKAEAMADGTIEAEAGNIGAISAMDGGIADTAIKAVAGTIGNVTAGATNANGTAGAIDGALFMAEAIGNVTATLSSKSGLVSAVGIGDSDFTATKGNIGNITATISGPASLTAAEGIDGSTIESQTGAIGNIVASVISPATAAALVGIRASNFTAQTSIGNITAAAATTAAVPLAAGSTAGIQATTATIDFSAGTSIGAIRVTAGGAGGSNIGLSASQSERIQFSAGTSVGTVSVSATPGKAKNAATFALSHVDLTAGGAIGKMVIGGDANFTQVFDFQVYAGGSIAGIGITSKNQSFGSISDSTILAGQLQSITKSTDLAKAGIGSVTISGSFFDDQNGDSTIGAQGNIGVVKIGGGFQNARIVAGINAGVDHLAYTADDTYNDAASIASVGVGGAFSDSSIVAGINSGADFTFGSGDDSAGASISGIKATSKIGAITLGAATLTAPGSTVFRSPAVADQTSAIEAVGLTSIKIGKLPVFKDFTVPVWIDANGDGIEQSTETLIRVVS